MTAELNPSDTNGSGNISTTLRSAQQQARTQNAALTGASLAFSNKPPVKPKPIVNTHSGSNGALAAATKVGGKSLSPANGSTLEQHMRSQRTGESSATDASEGRGVQRGSPQFNQRLNGLLQPPRNTADPAKSPAFMAANLAASRSASNSPSLNAQRLPSPVPSRRLSYASSTESHDRRPDVSSIPPTSSLVGMFEQNATTSQKKVVKRPVSPRPRPVSSASTLVLNLPLPPSPKKSTKPPVQPPRRASLEGLKLEKVKAPVTKPTPPAPRPMSSHITPPASTKDAPKPPVKPRRRASLGESTGDKAIHLPPKPAAPTTKPTSSVAPPKAIEQDTKPPVQPPRRASTTPKPPPPKSPKPKTILPSKPTSTPSNHDPNDSDASSNDSFVSASSQRRPSWRAELSQQPPRALPSHSTSPNPIDSLANAIVASSLASSRATSPSKNSLHPPAPPPTRRHKHNHHLFHHSSSPSLSRSTSPSRPILKTTMRKDPKSPSADENDKRRAKKHHLVKKHPNKHHEGDRKRWRDSITERERKRYEAVWASNRGLFPETILPNGKIGEVENAQDSVCGLVVRDIWQRSRLDGEVLGEVWDLVEGKGGGVAVVGRGRLGKEEFVVGMWLLDQRLKGRKLPIRVSDSVWRSVGGLKGIKVRRVGK
ncbi:hypothetical protein CJF32_00003489 [Rutstroemia sp. NJR-2017a WRK4]|nr:hypothetical protein CJF32_00003489 [Rutstroemia sp. NJR-2017a WRK4]